MLEERGQSSLPVIDISPFIGANVSQERRTQCATQLFQACRDTGFFYLTGHGIPESTTQNVLQLARQFFLESSDSEKALIRRQNPGHGDGDGARGYQQIGENVTGGSRDWHEAVDFYAEAATTPDEAPPYELLRGRNLWPRHPPDLKAVFTRYVEDAKEVGTAVVRAMGMALGLGEDEEVFVQSTRDSFWVMRMIGYPALPATMSQSEDDAGAFSCGSHTDYGCVTLLLADETKGALQVQAKNGDWIVADPMPGAFVVNIGDMMELWTNGLWKSTLHRVIHRASSYRISVPFFFEPNWEADIRPLKKCVEQTGGQELYPAVKYGDHLKAKVESNFY
jgi:isopenicillin N synthase-like dioxygenase